MSNEEQERRMGVHEIREDLAVLKNELKNHVDQEERTLESIHETLKTNSKSIECIKRSVEKQKSFVAGIMFAFTFLAGIIWFLINKVFP